MHIEVPPQFRNEILSSSPDELEGLRLDVANVILSQTPPDKAIAALVRAGWTSDFANWYFQMQTIQGRDITLVVPSKVEVSEQETRQAEWDCKIAYVSWGWRFTIIGMIALLGGGLLNLSMGAGSGSILSGVGVVLLAAGGWCLSLSKGYPGPAGLLIVFCVVPWFCWFFFAPDLRFVERPE